MIRRLRNIQDSWFIKLVLILTALSFMSLFGISGYLGSAGKNKTVIRVDNIEITQNQISNELNQEMQKIKSFVGDSIEINEGIRTTILQGIVQRELQKAILDKTAQDNHVFISTELIKKIISSQPDFMEADGRFSAQKMRRLLAAAGLSEQGYINSIKDELKKQHLVSNPVDNINIPTFMTGYLYKLENQKKVFKYIKISPSQLKIDRKISEDELEQYYNDFAAEYVDPEKRDISFISLNADEIVSKVNISNEQVEEYYNNNIDQYVTPETRDVLQMVFDNKEAADAALNKLKQGADFYAVAKSDANQDEATTSLGYVSKDMLIADMSDTVFSAGKNEVAGPIKSEFGWHLMKVVNIKPMQKTTLASAKSKIIEELRKEQSYDAISQLSTEIEDQIGAGKSLSEIAKEKAITIHKVTGLGEDGTYQMAPKSQVDLVQSPEFADTAFSYNENEVSQVIETDEGFAVLSVDKITEARQKSIDEVRNEIVKLWETNEKTAIAQEIINDVTNDLENGDKIDEIASRFHLKMQTTKPIGRTETFENLSPLQMQDLFKEELNSPKVISTEDSQIIAVVSNVINDSKPLSKDDIQNIRFKAQSMFAKDMSAQLIDGYAQNYKVRVKYKYIGLAD